MYARFRVPPRANYCLRKSFFRCITQNLLPVFSKPCLFLVPSIQIPTGASVSCAEGCPEKCERPGAEGNPEYITRTRLPDDLWPGNCFSALVRWSGFSGSQLPLDCEDPGVPQPTDYLRLNQVRLLPTGLLDMIEYSAQESHSGKLFESRRHPSHCITSIYSLIMIAIASWNKARDDMVKSCENHTSG